MFVLFRIAVGKSSCNQHFKVSEEAGKWQQNRPEPHSYCEYDMAESFLDHRGLHIPSNADVKKANESAMGPVDSRRRRVRSFTERDDYASV